MTEYIQLDTIARIEGSISVANCPAGSTGNFKILLRVRDQNGEMKSIELDQAWQRDDTEDYKFNADHMIGENMELMSVRLRSLDCTCAKTPAPETPPLVANPPDLAGNP